MKIKVLRCVSCILLACLILSAAMPQTGRAAAAEQPPLLIILLDVSKSMNWEENDRDKQAIKWTTGLSAICQEMGIDVEAFTFGENVNHLNSKAIPDETISYSEDLTDHRKAIEEAEKIVKEELTRKTCIVMLSDGALDLRGRGTGQSDKPRSPEEKAAIDTFQETCKQLGADGCKLFLVGCGTSEGNMDDIYATSGFGMFNNLNGKQNCKFLRASQMDLSELTQYVFRSLGYQNSTSPDLQMTGNSTITFSLDQQYYKTHVCVSKSVESEAPREEEIIIHRDEEVYSEFHVNRKYKSMFLVCLDEPGPGHYEIVLPRGGAYTLLIQSSVNPLFLEIEPARDQVKYIGGDPPTYIFPNGESEHPLEMSLKLSGITGKDVDKCWYTVLAEQQDGPEGRDCIPIEWGEDSSEKVVSLTLPEPSSGPDNASSVTYAIQAYLTTKNNEPIVSNLIHIQPPDLSSVPMQSFSGKVGEEIDISLLNWTQIDIRDDIASNDYNYYMRDHALAEGEELTNEMSLKIPSDTPEYSIWRDEFDALKIKFNEPGEYFMPITLYGKARAEAQGHFIIEDKPDPWNWEGDRGFVIVAAVLAVVFVAVIAIIAWKRKRR